LASEIGATCHIFRDIDVSKQNRHSDTRHPRHPRHPDTRHPRHSDTTGLDANEVQASMLTGLMMSRCLVCGKCVRGITHVHPPLSSHALLRLKLRPPSAECPPDISLHFQLLKLAPSGLNPPLLLPLFFFVEFHFQRLKMHLRCTK
jgi:hypothetical protein